MMITFFLYNYKNQRWICDSQLLDQMAKSECKKEGKIKIGKKKSNIHFRTLGLNIKKPHYRNEAEQILNFKNQGEK